MKIKLNIIKIGGNVIDHTETLQEVLQQFSEISAPKILVHGGGKIASELCLKMGVIPQMIEGRRVTDAETLKIVTMAYAGLINKNIVAQLQALGCNALGLTGADANIIPAHKRTGHHIDYGFVGDFDVDDIDNSQLHFFLKQGITPVLCAITHDGQGSLLNTNADTLAAGLAIALSSVYDVHLTYCFEKSGVLLDAEDDNSAIPELPYIHYQQLKQDGIINNGMIPKLDNAFKAKEAGINVVIKHALALNTPNGTTLL